jgi:hypothetical protein
MGWDASIRAVGTLITGDVNPLTDRAMERIKPFALEMLQNLTPVKTGYMKSSWNVKTTRRLIEIRNSAYYAGFINYGTIRGFAPRFMVEKTLDAVGEQLQEILVEEINGVQRTKSIRDFMKQVSKIRVRKPTHKIPSRT